MDSKPDKKNPAFVPKPIPTQVPRFEVNDDAGYAYLEENGFAVFKNVANAQQVETGRELAWKYVQQLNPSIDPSKPETWSHWPNSYASGIISGDCIGQSELLWFARGIPNVHKIYSKIWGTSELITSFDGCCFLRAWEYDPTWRSSNAPWFHLDQNGHHKPNKICVQGFLNFYPAGLEDGGLVVVPKSPTIFNQIFKSRPEFSKLNDFVPLTKIQSLWEGEIKNAGLSPIVVCCEPGDFVVWDSRTIHCSAPARSPRPLPEDDSVLPPRRLVTYVCMTPASRISSQQQNERIKAYKEGLTTSHWPEDCYTPAARKNNANFKYVPLELSEFQKKMIPLE